MKDDGRTQGGSWKQAAGMAAAVAALALAPLQARAEDAALPAMNSYAQPPYVALGTERGAGLAAAFVEQLNEAVGQSPRFVLENLPRRRLEQAFARPGAAGIALFLAPEFLAPAVQQGAAWSAPVMVDENVLVSVRPLKVARLEDLRGLRMGGVAGHLYRVLAPLVDEGHVERENAIDHLANLKKLCLGRVDFVVISRSELAGTEPQARCRQAFRPVAFPEPQVILRRVLVRIPGEEDADEVLAGVGSVACSARWAAQLARYGLSTVGCRQRGPAAGLDGVRNLPAAKSRRAGAPPVAKDHGDG